MFVSCRLGYVIALEYSNSSHVPKDFMCSAREGDGTGKGTGNWYVFKYFDITAKIFPGAAG